jgi:hypothetical protein
VKLYYISPTSIALQVTKDLHPFIRSPNLRLHSSRLHEMGLGASMEVIAFHSCILYELEDLFFVFMAVIF